jgi:hypothetical protein
MSGKLIRQLLLACVLLAVYIGFTSWKHRYDRPWAYSYDSSTPLLVGKWQGRFKDPNGISKQMDLEIAEPKEKRRNSSKSKGHNGDPALRFKGTAIIKSKLGVEDDRIEGILKSSDGHEIQRISFVPATGEKFIAESFNVSLSEPGGTWQGDVIQLKISFTYRTKTGASYTNNYDDRYDQKTPVTLHRK